MPLAKHLPKPSWAALGSWAGFRLGNSRREAQLCVSDCMLALNETRLRLLGYRQERPYSAQFCLRQTSQDKDYRGYLAT